MFLSFLSAPTVISLIQDDADISMAYNLAEEEIQKEIKEVKAAPEKEFQLSLLRISKKSTLINFENLQRHENAFGDIFSPPPELI